MAELPYEPWPSAASLRGDDPTLIAGDAPADEHDEDRAPNHIGRYVVLKPIGEGGMGLVFAAYDAELDRKVAVKLVRPGTSEEMQRRLLREAQALAKLSHPNIIHVYEVGALRDSVFLAMEYFEGPTLKRWQDRSDVSRREILAAYLAAGRGLEAAHAAGLVHRDFKAENVLVGKDGQVRVIDFGLARETATGPLDLSPADSIKALTVTGAIMGTPAYMAPEQHAAGKVDARTDQFSFCVSLYEALYGERPFAGHTIGELTNNVMKGNVQPPPRFEPVPPWIRRALLRGLSVEPEQRYPNIGELLAELGHDRAVRRRRIVIGVVLLGLLIAGIVIAWDRASQAQRARVEGERLREEFGRARASNAEEELHRLHTRTATQRWDDLVLAWATERVEVDPTRALASLRHLQDLDANLGAARTIAADAWHRGVARESIPLSGKIVDLEVSPSGDFVATLAAGGVVQAWRRGHDDRRLMWDCPEPVASMAVSPQAPIVAVGSKSGTIFIVHLGERVHSFSAHEGSVDALAFSSDGSVLASGGADQAVRRWHGVSGARIDAMTNHDAPVVALSYDLGGTALASGAINGQLAWWDIETSKVRKVTAQGGRVESLAAAGGTVWTAAADGRVSRWRPGSQARLTDIHGVASLQVTSDGGLVFVHRDGTVTWSDDPEVPPRPLHAGAAVIDVAHSPRDGGVWLAGPELGVRRWDATPDYARAVPFEGSVGALAFSPDGSLLAIGGVMGTLEIIGVRHESSGEAKLGGEVELGGRPVRASFSPTGERLAVQLLDGGIVIVDPRAPTANPVRFSGDPAAPILDHSNGAPHPALAWTDDGSTLAFARCPGATSCLLARIDGHTAELRGTEIYTDFVSTLDTDANDTSILLGRRDSPMVTVLDLTASESDEFNFTADGDQRVLGQAWSDEGDGRVRIATASEGTLSVWSWQPTSEQRHLVLEETGFTQLQPSEDGTAVYLYSRDRMAVLWSIAGTRFLPVPELPEGVDQIRLSDDGRTLLARGSSHDGGEFGFVFSLAIGHGRRLPRLLEPVALSVDGVVADHRHGPGVRIWDEPTPKDAAGFRTWLDQATMVQVPLEDFRIGN